MWHIYPFFFFFSQQEFTRKEELSQRWLLTAEDLRAQIKQGVSCL